MAIVSKITNKPSYNFYFYFSLFFLNYKIRTIQPFKFSEYVLTLEKWRITEQPLKEQ